MTVINLLLFLPWVLVPTCLLKCEHLTTWNTISELTDVTFLHLKQKLSVSALSGAQQK